MTDLPVWFTALALFLLGLIIGSFLNVVIHRIPAGQSIVSPRSHCPSCKTPIKWYHNVPLLGYLVLGGRCATCKTKIPITYPAVELLVGLLYLGLVFKNGLSAALVAEIIFVSFIVPLVVIDIKHKILPDLITLRGFIVMVIVRMIVPDPLLLEQTRWMFGLTGWPDYAVALTAALLGAAVGSGSLLLIILAYYLWRRVEGMGLGDVKMMLLVGAFLGWRLTLVTIILATIVASVVGIGLMASRRGGLKTEIPFGAFLGPAAIVAMWVGERLLEWYLAMYR